MIAGICQAKTEEEIYTAKIKLNLFINQFTSICQDKAILLINDFCLPDEQQQFKEIKSRQGYKKYHFQEE